MTELFGHQARFGHARAEAASIASGFVAGGGAVEAAAVDACSGGAYSGVAWSLATAVARRHGVSRTAGVPKLEYYALKERLTELSPGGGVAGRPILPRSFVELTPGPLPTPSPCEIEFSDALGSTLRIRLPAGQVPDLVALVRSCRQSL